MYLCGEQRCTVKLHDAWQQHHTPFCKLNLYSNRHVQWPVHPFSCSFSILKLDGMSNNGTHNVGICCVYVNKYVTFCCFSGTSHPCEAPSKFSLSLRLSACMCLITGRGGGEWCWYWRSVWWSFQVISIYIKLNDFDAHITCMHTVASLLCPHIPFMSHAIVALLLGHEESLYLEQ
jgi:hypothetical protein